MEAVGPGQEISRREATDKLSVSRAGKFSTSNGHGKGWSINPANFAVLTNDPLVWVPVNAPLRISRDEYTDSADPVTLAPGGPSGPIPDLAIPHGREEGTEPGKAEITGTVALIRQPVEFTLRNPNGVSETVTGDALYWSTVNTPAPSENRPVLPSSSFAGPSETRPVLPSLSSTTLPADAPSTVLPHPPHQPPTHPVPGPSPSLPHRSNAAFGTCPPTRPRPGPSPRHRRNDRRSRTTPNAPPAPRNTRTAPTPTPRKPAAAWS